MEEIWKDIKFTDTDGKEYDYTGYYQVSNMGRVRSLKGHTKILKPGKNKDGYLHYSLSENGKSKIFKAHRLVAHMFIKNPNNLPIVNHKDEHKSNNHVENLEWCTAQYNVQYSSHKISGEFNGMHGKNHTEETRQKMSKNHADFTGSKHPKAREIICVETGMVFGSISEAKKWLGTKSNIGASLKDNKRTAGGYHWQYVDDTDE